MEEFKKYQHIERIDREEVSDLCIGECFIFPKLDGSNGSVFLKNGKITCGSRNRSLDDGQDDNAGFREFINSNEEIEKYTNFFKDNPNLIIYGEWLVPHTIKYYRDDCWRKFYIFDVCYLKEGKTCYLPYYEYKNLLNKYNLDFIPPLSITINPRISFLEKQLENNSFLMKEGFKGEGIVIKRYDYVNKFGHTIWGKLIRNEFKDEHYKNDENAIKQKNMVEEDIVEKYLTQSLLEKEKSKIENFNNKDIPKFFGIIQYNLIREDLWDIIKKYNNPVIDFKFLNQLVINRCKKFLNL